MCFCISFKYDCTKQNVRGRVQERTRTKKRNTYRQVAVGWGIRNQKFKGATFDESAVGSTDSCHFLNSYYCAPRKGAQECNVRCEFKLLQFKRRFDKSLSPLVTSRAAGDSLECFIAKAAIENENPLSRALPHMVIVLMAALRIAAAAAGTSATRWPSLGVVRAIGV